MTSGEIAILVLLGCICLIGLCVFGLIILGIISLILYILDK